MGAATELVDYQYQQLSGPIIPLLTPVLRSQYGRQTAILLTSPRAKYTNKHIGQTARFFL